MRSDRFPSAFGTRSRLHVIESGSPPDAGRRLALKLGGACTVVWVAGCGGVGEEGTGRPVAALGIGAIEGLTDTQIIVNAVTYERVGTRTIDGFGGEVSADALALGMWVEIQASVDQDTGVATATSCRLRLAARGVVTSVDTATGTVGVLGSMVQTTSNTVLAGVAGASAVRPGDVIEVHAPLAAAGSTGLSATRLQRLEGPPLRFERRGRVTALDTSRNSFRIGNLSIDYAAAALTLTRSLANGLLVRVAASHPVTPGAPWAVSRVDTDLPAQPIVGFLYAEGFIDNLSEGPRFELEALEVNASTASGRGLVVANDQRLAVIGALSGGVLQARSVAVVEPGKPVVFTLGGNVAGFASVADFTVRATAIDASTARFDAGTAADLANGRRVVVTGVLQGRRLIASALRFLV